MTSNLSRFEEFCGNSPFWDDSLFQGSYPRFTECFNQIALQWIPCMLFLMAAVPYICIVYGKNYNKPIRAGFLAKTKTVFSLLLLAVTIATLIVRATDSDQDSISGAFYVSEGLKTVCFILTTTIIHLDRRKGYVRSPLLWFFWFFILVCSIVPFYSNIEENVQDEDMFGFIIFYVYFTLVLLSFVSTSFADVPWREDGLQQGKISPELVASVPSLLSMFWLISFIYKGYKKPLEEKDVFDSNPKDLLENTVPPFEKIWQKEESEVKDYNSKHRPPADAVLSKSAKKGKLDEKTPLIPPGKSRTKGKSDGKSPSSQPGMSGRKGKFNGKSPRERYKIKETPSWKKEVSLLKVLFKAYWPYFLVSQIIITSCDIFKFVTPSITEALLKYITFRSSYPEWQGYSLAASFVVVLSISSIGSNAGSLIARRIGAHIRGVLMHAIYKKSLTVSSINDDLTTGQVVNLMAIDCQIIENLTQFMYVFLSAPFQIALAIYLLYDKMELATFAGIAVILLVLPLNVIIAKIVRSTQMKQLRLKDKRVKTTTEVLNGIKVLKLYAWEDSFQERIEDVREEELKVIKISRQAVGFMFYVFSAIPTLVQIVAFAVYIAISDEGYLSPIVASVSMQLFSLLNSPLTVIPNVAPQALQAKVSVERISKYLNEDDVAPDIVEFDEGAENAVEIKDGEFTWDFSLRSTLRNINLALKPGSLVAVVGLVGSGKSSLLSAILGEMAKIKGKVTLKDSIAYVPQEAWIQNATLRSNILFGSSYNRKKFGKIIEACALKSDLEILPGGDKTEIGEKGINISGGQKQRVSLARAVYSDKQIYLLDDPLSAVDSHVGKHIFKNIISDKGALRKKTRILVTHGIHWLPMVDNIIVMGDGQISEIGTYEELISRDGAFAQFLIEHAKEDVASDDEEQTDPEVEAMKQKVLQRLGSVTGSLTEGSTSGDELAGKKSSRKKSLTSSQQFQGKHRSQELSRRGSELDPMDLSVDAQSSEIALSQSDAHVPGEKLVEEEKKEVGKIKWSMYWYYLQIFGIEVIIFAIILNICSAGMTFFTGIWLSEWTGDTFLANTSRSGEDEYESKTVTYMAVYGAAGVSQGLFVLTFALLLAVLQTKVSRILHNNMLTNVLHLPMSFFDTTPSGRILNRFSQDIETIDNTLPRNLRQMLNSISRIVGNIVTISYGTPIFLVALVPLGIIYLVITVIFVPASRQLRRLVSVSKSPIFTHFSESLNGVSSIRAYKCENRFLDNFRERVDHNMKFYIINLVANIWRSLWLQFLGNFIVFATAIFLVSDPDTEAGMAGVSISYATMITGSLQMLVNAVTMLENNLVAVERIQEYSTKKREADWINHNHRPDSDWPQDGEVTFKNYEMRYRPGLELVLKGMSCKINGAEKIGIVGRTGAGKSSMTVALFRIIEAAGGQIMIDDEDIASMGLHDLRKKLTILPQEPVLFSGTIRMNLDPFSKSSDNALWDALERSYLKDFVQGLPTGLSYECGEGGSNLSVGQRQLICLGRTLLRKTKILVLDEATAAIDMETDELIQQTIREEFKDSTVLTIAHRLNTILDYDRVMVLDKGVIKEFDTPSNLLNDKTTAFYSMAKDAGLI